MVCNLHVRLDCATSTTTHLIDICQFLCNVVLPNYAYVAIFPFAYFGLQVFGSWCGTHHTLINSCVIANGTQCWTKHHSAKRARCRNLHIECYGSRVCRSHKLCTRHDLLKEFLESLGLQIKLPMTPHMDNKEGDDIFNNWNIAGNTRALSIQFAYIWEFVPVPKATQIF